MSRLEHYQPFRAARQFLGELELIVGFLSLGLATLLFRIESRRLDRSDGTSQALALLSMMTAGAFVMIVARRTPITWLKGP